MSGNKPQQFEILDEDKRIIAGWASTEVVDLHGDLVPIEEIRRGMYNLMARGGNILYGHSNKPVGKILEWDVRKHSEANVDGLWIVAQIYKDYPLDDEVWAMIKRGLLKGFSIGGQGKKAKAFVKGDKSKTVNVVHDLNLMEISIVPTPANPLATIEQVNYIAKGLGSKVVGKVVDISHVLEKYGIDRDDLEKLSECDFCENVKKIYGEAGDLDIALKVSRLLSIRKAKLERLRKEAEDVEKKVRDLKEYEKKVLENRIESNEAIGCPADEFAGELLKKIEDVKKQVEEIMKPFGKWDSFADCVSDMKSKGYSEESAKRICGSLQSKLEKSDEDIDKQVDEIIELIKQVQSKLEEYGIYWPKSRKRYLSREKIPKTRQSSLFEHFKSLVKTAKRVFFEKQDDEDVDEYDVVCEVFEKYIDGEELSEFEERIVNAMFDAGIKELEEVGDSLGAGDIDLSKDKRPPKEWFDRCVDRTGNPRLCGWVFYRHLHPTKPKSKREPDEPHTRRARARKRAWLSSWV